MSDQETVTLIAKILALLVAIVGHEVMHGLIAYYYGDNTAKDAGRLKLNPLVHVDPVGTVLVPGLLFVSGAPFLFGWAKPVPINPETVVRRGGFNAAIYVSLAGIAFNLALAFVASMLVSAGPFGGYVAFFFHSLLLYLVVFNVVLAVVNLWPIPPLDGSRALAYLGYKLRIPQIGSTFNKIEPFGIVILIAILATPLSSIFFAPVQKLLQVLLTDM